MCLPTDLAFRILANQYRRQLLLWLVEENPEKETKIPNDITFLGTI